MERRQRSATATLDYEAAMGRLGPLVERVWDLMQAGRVVRFHTLPGGINQTTAEHSGRVAMLVYLLTGGQCRAQVLWYALVHDLPEAVTGDIPAPAKWASVLLRDSLDELESRVAQAWQLNGLGLTQEEYEVVGLADAIDGMLTCIQERRRGNHEVARPFFQWRDHLEARFGETGRDWALLLVALWHDYQQEWNPWRQLEAK